MRFSGDAISQHIQPFKIIKSQRNTEKISLQLSIGYIYIYTCKILPKEESLEGRGDQES